MAIQRTLSIIKPDATARNITGNINAHLEKAGLRIIAQRRIRMSLDQAEGFYAEHRERPFFMISKAYDKAETARLTEPPPEDSTELGEVPPAEEKGALGTAGAYGIGGTHQQRGRRYV